jgi:hypothetical protein
MEEMPQDVEAVSMPSTPAVRCVACGFAWNSAAMAEGLKLIGSCPKCDGTLEFRDEIEAAERTLDIEGDAERAAERGVAPHLALGIPRR